MASNGDDPVGHPPGFEMIGLEDEDPYKEPTTEEGPSQPVRLDQPVQPVESVQPTKLIQHVATQPITQEAINQSIMNQLTQLNVAIAEVRQVNSVLSRQNEALNSQIQSMVSITSNPHRLPTHIINPITTRLDLNSPACEPNYPYPIF